MLRSILVALDGSTTSIAAGRLALGLARRHEAAVEGLGVVDSAWIQHPLAAPLEAAMPDAIRAERALASPQERLARVLRDFRAQAREAQVPSPTISEADGCPVRAIERECVPHDLVVVGRDSLVDADGELHDLTVSVDRVVRTGPRPVLLVPAEPAHGRGPDAPVLVAFDGSPAAARALHLFALLGLAGDRPVHVATLDDASTVIAQRTAEQACALLRRHGVAQAHALGFGDDEAGSPGEMILGVAKSLGAGMIVMGAYGHSGFREIFGSCTRAVLKACPVPLFLHQ